MTACDGRCIPIPLPAGWGRAILHHGPHAGRATRARRSYDALGRALAWDAPLSHAACDVESVDIAAPALVRRFGCSPAELAPRWVVTETLAKLTHTPVLLHVREHGLAARLAASDHPVRIHHHALSFDLVVRHVTGPAAGAFVAFGRHAREPRETARAPLSLRGL